MTRVFYDFEFIEDGRTIVPISIGMTNDNGDDELYAVNRDAPWDRIVAHEWLPVNVLPHLPLTVVDGVAQVIEGHPDAGRVMSHTDMVAEVAFFLGKHHPVELWAYFGAYDHVTLAQMWGPMASRHPAMPMVTHDIVTAATMLGVDSSMLPPEPTNAHHSLADARWTREAFRAVQALDVDRLTERLAAVRF